MLALNVLRLLEKLRYCVMRGRGVLTGNAMTSALRLIATWDGSLVRNLPSSLPMCASSTLVRRSLHPNFALSMLAETLSRENMEITCFVMVLLVGKLSVLL